MIIGRKIPGPAVNARRAEDGKAAIGETATKHIKKTNITMSIIMLVALFDIAAGLDQQFALNKKKLLKGNSNTVDFARKTQEVDDSVIAGIIGGSEYEPGRYSFLVSIGSDLISTPNGHACGGMLIAPNAVLTSAQCFTCGQLAADAGICTVGGLFPMEWIDFKRHDLTNDTGVVRMPILDIDGVEIIRHPDYVSNGTDIKLFDNDVSVIILPSRVTDIVPVRLNENPALPGNGDVMEIIGWGAVGFKPQPDYPNVPSVGEMAYVSNDVCSDDPYLWSPERITDNMLCAYSDSQAACFADAGGPLIQNTEDGPVLTGVISYGETGCLNEDYPNVFVRISKLAEWIKDTVCMGSGDLCPTPGPSPRPTTRPTSSITKSKSGKRKASKSSKGTKSSTSAPSEGGTDTHTSTPTADVHDQPTSAPSRKASKSSKGTKSSTSAPSEGGTDTHTSTPTADVHDQPTSAPSRKASKSSKGTKSSTSAPSEGGTDTHTSIPTADVHDQPTSAPSTPSHSKSSKRSKSSKAKHAKGKKHNKRKKQKKRNKRKGRKENNEKSENEASRWSAAEVVNEHNEENEDSAPRWTVPEEI